MLHNGAKPSVFTWRWTTFKPVYPGQKDARSFGKLFSSPSKVLNRTIRPSCPDILPRYRPWDFFPSSRHIVPRTTNSSTPPPRVSVKQPLFHLVLPEYPRALSFDLEVPFLPFHSFFRFSFSVRLELYTLVSISLFSSLSLPLTLFLFRPHRTVYPHYFFLILSPRHHRLPTWRRRSMGKKRSIEYRLRSIWNARNERGWSRQTCVCCDVSKEKTVNSTRKTDRGGKVTKGISN